MVRVFTDNVSLDEIPFGPTSIEPQKYKKDFEFDGKPVELNIWDTLGESDVEVTKLRKKIYPLIVRLHLILIASDHP